MSESQFSLVGRTAIVTGSSQGLGREIALGLARAGAQVMLVARQADKLQEIEAQIRAFGGRADLEQADITSPGCAPQIVRRTELAFGSVDILVNNAGGYIKMPVSDITDESWLDLFQLNVTAVMRMTRAASEGMRARAWGRIINVSSVLGLASRPGCATYSATKSALIGYTRAVALDLGPYGITANCIAPGAFNTTEPESTPDARQMANFDRSTALGRWGKPSELIGPILLLASNAGSYITGSVLVVDGGALARTLY